MKPKWNTKWIQNDTQNDTNTQKMSTLAHKIYEVSNLRKENDIIIIDSSLNLDSQPAEN